MRDPGPRASQVQPGSRDAPTGLLQPQHLTAFIAERSTVTSGVPTIWNAILDCGMAIPPAEVPSGRA